ncbi:hypothetical protein JOF53_002081 [Crossiella equi]|uniref:DUF998 domain-containing protein n=1 Tax=Crossiella equi TaxID=130796 RepID=A0ABS5A9D8_9PSEU|nr:DUF998 domain-containing protein [Crossiella equi]MBP2473209.1 hypothetical protein [Crossiella equi]
MIIAGALLWILAAVLCVGGQLAATLAWETPYSWGDEQLSHLGNTTCGLFLAPAGPPHFVCSPLHSVVNTTTVLAGACLIGGALLLRKVWPLSWAGGTAYLLMVFAGVLQVVSGLVPEDVNLTAHLLAAPYLPISGLAAFLVSVAVRPKAPAVAVFGYLSAAVTVLASMLFTSGLYSASSLHFGLGAGGMQRLSVYAFNLWLVVIGIILCVWPARAGCRAGSPRAAVDQHAA